MKLFAVSDLHLPGGTGKAMDPFGNCWTDHWRRIREDWDRRVGDGDVVLIPGDISWAMVQRDAMEDLRQIGERPGTKILLRGNHDYWWSSITRLRAELPAGIHAIQNDAVCVAGTVICGTRGWLCPGSANYTSQDEKIYTREVQRLGLSLEAAKRLAERTEAERIIVMMHFPPMVDRQTPNSFTDLLEGSGVRDVYYGHLHGAAIKGAVSGNVRGVRYRLVSCDALSFMLFGPEEMSGTQDGEE